MYAWQFAKALYLADLNGWTRFVSMQDHYNLIHREAEREMLPLCADQGIGVVPWSPLARGRLTRARDTATARAETDEGGQILYRDGDQTVAERAWRSPSTSRALWRAPGSPVYRRAFDESLA